MSDSEVTFIHTGSVAAEQARRGNAYLEFLRVASMSAGIYVLRAGGSDGQSPHRQDELYYVLHGKARMRAGTQDQAVRPGSIIFIAAGVEHRFYDIEEEIALLVLFAPPETE